MCAGHRRYRSRCLLQLREARARTSHRDHRPCHPLHHRRPPLHRRPNHTVGCRDGGGAGVVADGHGDGDGQDRQRGHQCSGHDYQ